MSAATMLSSQQLDVLNATAAILLPGSSESPAAQFLPEFCQLLQQAAAALGRSDRELSAAIGQLPNEPSWENLSSFALRDPATFEMVSLLVVGAYFMSPAVLTSLGRPSGKRRPADPEQVVDELGDGLLDAVFERGCPVRTLAEVNRGAAENG